MGADGVCEGEWGVPKTSQGDQRKEIRQGKRNEKQTNERTCRRI